MRARALAAVVATAGVPASVALMSVVVSRRGPGFSTVAAAPSGEVVLIVPAAACVVAAAFVAVRPRRRRFAALLAAVASAWLVTEWDNPDAGSAAVFSTGLVLFAVLPVAVVHVALTYPSGRLPSRSVAGIVGVGYAVAVGVQGVLSAFWFAPSGSGCLDCPANLWLFADDPARTAAADTWGIRLGLTWCAVGGVLLAARLLRLSVASRRAYGGVLLAGLVFTAVTTASYARTLDRGLPGSDDVDHRLWIAQAVALTALAVAVLAELVREKRARHALARMVVDLSRVARPTGSLRDALAARLSDPYLALAYPVDGGTRFVDASAKPVSATVGAGQVATDLTYAGQSLGLLVHRADALVGGEAVEDLTATIHLGLEHERLRAEALAQVADLRASGLRLVAAGDAERRRLERDLHDGAQQRLVGLALGLRLLAGRAAESPVLTEASVELDAAIDDLRSIARGLTPLVLTDAGLAAAVRALAEGRSLRVAEVPSGRYSPVVESTSYLAVDRASAASPSAVTIREELGALVVRVEVRGPEPDLSDLADRVTTLDGELAVSSHGDRCLVFVRVPTTSDWPQP